MEILEVLEESKFYKIIISPSLIKIKKEIEGKIYAQLISVMNFFQIKEIEQLTIFIYDNKNDFKNVTKYPYNLGPLAGAYNHYAIYVYADLNKITIEELCNSIIHEVIHKIYNYYILIKTNEPKLVWLEEGLAQYLSNEKEHLKDNQTLRTFLRIYVFNENKIIPDIRYLSKHGNKFGSFIDEETNKYNGYVWSYLIVRYLIETKTKEEFLKLIRNPSSLSRFEQTLIEDTINYYKSKIRGR